MGRWRVDEQEKEDFAIESDRTVAGRHALVDRAWHTPCDKDLVSSRHLHLSLVLISQNKNELIDLP